MVHQTLSDAERKAIRKYYFQHHQGACYQCNVIPWFHKEHGKPINQSQVPKILDDKNLHLDTLTASPDLCRKKCKKCEWRALKQALSDWQVFVKDKGAMISREHLRLKAQVFWDRLRMYQNVTSASIFFGMAHQLQELPWYMETSTSR